MSKTEQLVELPIDHFRLLGVSPSAEAETVLRTLQLRLDRPPEEGFTHESLVQRSELLRLSSDLLSNEDQRKEYEAALLGGALGLEISTNREVAGLILLWEAEASFEAFKIACNSLKPPQAPALGSGREADLTLVAALSCRAAALQETELRHYESAAKLLREGRQLLQRMGKLPEQRENLEKDLEALLPYRILDLVSRDLGDQRAHQEGIRLLDAFVTKRGGIEGRNKTMFVGSLEQSDFEAFFQQIRKFLTVQEQADLFNHWNKTGSADAGFLEVLALVAAGFSRRKPERIQEARKKLNALDIQGLDVMPLLGCMDVLLADIQRAKDLFARSSDEGLISWLEEYPGDDLAALCDYCRDWLRNDVLPGYRDLEVETIDLEAWFADRDVQSYIEQIDKKGALGIAKAGFSFLSSLTSEQPEEEDKDVQTEIDLESRDSDEIKSESGLDDSSVPEKIEEEGYFDDSLEDIRSNLIYIWINLKNKFYSLRKLWILLFISAALVSFGIVSNSVVNKSRLNTSEEVKKSNKEENLLKDKKSPIDKKLSTDKPKPELTSTPRVLISKEPNKDELLILLNGWLENKAIILSGKRTSRLGIFAREALVKRVFLERSKDRSNSQKQNISASIQSLKIISRTSNRIELKARLSYKDQRLKNDGGVISETTIPLLRVTYILGREDEVWKLVDYISGT